ncbi:hypothetical protein BDQ94DRAFT_132850 [Aspergillus welwitschiae]|uniref:Uncharacterized protein n=1 Tax=Aspergillus welwitschiae TaxID=1341132 RepID=A0A3F3QJK3_9EURO|nr:hypothetical protein BDQ94DRAFT_132850 [Aspergillus welwitschiae]RDH39305.1 hypothetical protein BDQ94DRAFT_132850 [Aspergillus welwitschiae]
MHPWIISLLIDLSAHSTSPPFSFFVLFYFMSLGFINRKANGSRRGRETAKKRKGIKKKKGINPPDRNHRVIDPMCIK